MNPNPPVAGPEKDPATGRTEHPFVMTPSADAHVRLDAHPTHTSAVTATITGPGQNRACALLTARGFEALTEDTLVMARIDHEESQ
ncbi:hypothetical protein ACIBO6_24495 [Streptomyces luteogriseus]|uniref:hypothetical protein n=1 Tax=Streptomyces luteogriseus TaxID=68233 RepID=UPI00378D79F4